jgi:hypothetical protein
MGQGGPPATPFIESAASTAIAKPAKKDANNFVDAFPDDSLNVISSRV